MKKKMIEKLIDVVYNILRGNGVRYNFSEGIDYHTQRNNLYVPFSSCNVTSLIMALKQAGVGYEIKTEGQDEDFLYTLVTSPQAKERQKHLYPWAEDLPPNQNHYMLEWAVNLLLTRREVDRFSTKYDFREILYNLIKGGGACMSGKFTPYGHIVSIAGFYSTQKGIKSVKSHLDIELKKVKKIIIDDPFGNYHTHYKDFRGNNIEFDFEELNDLTNTYTDSSKKWAHLIRKEW